METQKTLSLVSLDIDTPVAIIRYANPPFGLIANQGAAQLHEAVLEALAKPHVRVLVLTGGQSDVFIRHADVSQIARAAEALQCGKISPETFFHSPFSQLCQLLARAGKPTIAAINGVCMGGGYEIALACTLRIASRSVNCIGLPETRVGIFPGAGGTQRLPALIGQSRARLHILEGHVLNAEQAFSAGLVDEISHCAMKRSLEIAHRICKRSPAVVSAILSLTNNPAELDSEAEQIAFSALLRDDKNAVRRLKHFVENAERLEDLDT